MYFCSFFIINSYYFPVQHWWICLSDGSMLVYCDVRIRTVQESLSRSSPTESITKYTHTFVTCRSCTLLSLWNGSSISDTAGSTVGMDFLEICVGRSAIFHTIQWNPANTAFVTAVLFLEIRKNHKGPNKAFKEDWETQRWLKRSGCFCLSASNRRTNGVRR